MHLKMETTRFRTSLLLQCFDVFLESLSRHLIHACTQTSNNILLVNLLQNRNIVEFFPLYSYRIFLYLLTLIKSYRMC